MNAHSFLNLGIKGESTDKDHKDWIMVESCLWKQPEPGHGRAIQVTVNHGPGFPLKLRLCKGTHIPELVLDIPSHGTGVESVLAGKGTHIPEVHALAEDLFYVRYCLREGRVTDVTATPTADIFTLEYVEEWIRNRKAKQKPDGTGAG